MRSMRMASCSPTFRAAFRLQTNDLPRAIQEAAHAHFHEEELEAVPLPTALKELVARSDYQGGVWWMLADIDLGRLDARPVRINVSPPANLVREINAYAEANHLSHSGFVAKATRQAI